LQVLPDTLAARVRDHIQLNTAVTGITRSGGGWSVAFKKEGQPALREHSSVVFAGTAFRLAELSVHCGGLIDTAVFGQIQYPPVASIVLGFQREHVAHPLDGFGMLVPGAEGFNILGTIFSSSLFPNRAPRGTVAVTTYVGGARRPELAGQSESGLVKLVCADLKTILGVRGEPVFTHISVSQRAIPQYTVGYARFKSLMDEVERKAPGFHLAGHFRDGVSLSDSILAGMKVAERIQKA
jgi:protoporphyrinogen/coproporphyrinogen III oxidase